MQFKGNPSKAVRTNGSTFLDLPAELREQIYRFTLTPYEYIIITASLKEPSLLSVNRQIRREARDLWYHNNNFVAKILDCDDS